MENVGILYCHCHILRSSGKWYVHLVYFVVNWYIFARFGMLYREKSGNPVLKVEASLKCLRLVL
jgi:hypothetical protein